MDLYEIKEPSFLKSYNNKQLESLAQEIRAFLIENIAKTGGHLSSNLGVVELSIALHYVFNSPQDKIFFDVGHQSYVHKILTGRAHLFNTLRQYQGLSGYQKRSESIHDCFEAGHSSTTISSAIGMAISNQLDGLDYSVIPVIGDGALTGGVAFEALNHLGDLDSKVIVILNDNNMSISQNVGGFNIVLDHMRSSMPYNKAKQNYKDNLSKTRFGKAFYNFTSKLKKNVKRHVVSNIFTDMGIDYIGPVDGHDFQDLIRVLNKAKLSSRSIVVHVVTKKGKGYLPAENDESGKWHGIGQFNVDNGQTITQTNAISYSEVVADALLNEMKSNKDIVCITPAMIGGSKLEKIFKEYPQRSFDVGIAEQHATLLAAGLALSNKHPFLSIYSSFSQRAYDQFNHDLSRMDLPVVIGMDRAGLVGEDGETHHGVFDIALFSNLPHFIISAPANASEIQGLMPLAFATKHPFIIRYPRGNACLDIINNEQVTLGNWPYYTNNKSRRLLISYGVHSAHFHKLIKDNKTIDHLHALFIKPLDYNKLDYLLNHYDEIIIYEPDIKGGGFASAILAYANQKKYNTNKITIVSIDNKFIGAGSIDKLMETNELNYQDVLNKYFS
ncbi:MAG: 1-deoxy-D-xylulose-5-phosphate synthase [Bacilli bacterium]